LILTGLLIKIEHSESSITIPNTWEIDLGDDKPNLLDRKNCFLQRKNFVSEDAEILVLVLLSGPPDGGFPIGMLSLTGSQMSSNHLMIVVLDPFYFLVCLFLDV
jgi:hypothetical protein